ncbi:MAG: glycoside hydrolase family 13 protein [Saccharofermentanales bacterium]
MHPHWKNAVVYQVYPRSYQDSDGDGIGDLRGIISRLDHIAGLGANVIWLSPVYRSPNDDNGYDISDYRGIHPDFGTMADMEELILQAGRRGIGIVMDLVINHTSDEHEWFMASRDPSGRFRGYYFWREGVRGGPPNNWTSFFGGSAWQKDEAGGGYYLHLFSKKQPDLNYHNPEVLREIKEIMQFWLQKGIVGFRCDVINIIWKTSLDNGRPSLILTGSEHYVSQDGAHRILKELRQDVLSRFDCFTVGETVFVTPATAVTLCSDEAKELDMVFAFEHMECDQIIVKWFKRKFHPANLFRIISRWQQAVVWNAVYLENHDQPRSVSRFISTPEFRSAGAKALSMMLLSLRGTPYIYQGQEIGMTNFDFTSMADIRDVESRNIYALMRRIGLPQRYVWRMIRLTSRDNARTPMQWDSSAGAGFTEGTPWLGISANHVSINVAAQTDDPDSVLSFYRKMISLRRTQPALIDGSYQEIAIRSGLYVFERSLPAASDDGESSGIRTAVNLSKKPVRYACGFEILLSTTGRREYDGVLKPYEGILFDCEESTR